MNLRARLLISCLALATASCGSTRDSTGQSSSTSVTQQDPSRVDGPPQEAIVNAMKKWTFVNSFRLHFTVTSPDGSVSPSKIEFVAPDRFHLVTEIEGQPYESIDIGRISYFKEPGGQWAKSDPSGTQTGARGRLFGEKHQLDNLSRDVSDAQYVGEELVEATPARVYRFKFASPGAEGGHDATLWVGVSDGLPRKVESVYEDKSQGVTTTKKWSGVYSDYNTVIRIEPPIP